MKIKAVVLGSLIFGSLFVSCASTDAKALQERREVQTEVTSFISGIDGVSEGYAVYTKEKKVRVFIEAKDGDVTNELASKVKAQIVSEFGFAADDVTVFEIVEGPFTDAK